MRDRSASMRDMWLNRRTVARVILLLCVTLLVTRVAGNHLHLCFDGSEPPVSFHTLGVDALHVDEDLEHNDQDISLPNATLAKVASFLIDSALIATLLLCIVQLLRPQSIRPASIERYVEHSILHLLLPPLRGPPLLLAH